MNAVLTAKRDKVEPAAGAFEPTYQFVRGDIEIAKDVWLFETPGHAAGHYSLMVKPAGLYLDIIRDVREVTRKPVAAYQISGEYAQIHAAARLGWLDLARCRHESLLAIKRAGADLILTYFAKEMAQLLRR